MKKLKTEMESLIKLVEEWKRFASIQDDKLHDYVEISSTLRDKIYKYETALKWYANPDNHKRIIPITPSAPIDEDYGYRAREAIGILKGE